MMDWSPLLLTFELATVTTICLLLLGIPLAYWLSHSSSWFKTIVETLVSMPLVLPPTVIGFYLLVALSPHSFIGYWFDKLLGIQLIFSFSGLIVASTIYSLPFMVQPVKSGISNLPSRLTEAASILGKSRFQTFRHVLLPNIKPALLTALILTFAHTIGEFGVILMIGGNIPGKTKVASVAIYEQVESLNYSNAHHYSLVLFGISFILLLSVNIINRRHTNKQTLF